MIIRTEKGITPEQLEAIKNCLRQGGYSATEVQTQSANYIVAVGKKDLDVRTIGAFSGVADVHRVPDQYKLVSRMWKVGESSVDLGDGVRVGGGFAVMAGPCSIESEDQVQKTIEHLVANKVRIMRGGAFKPRTSPYSFQGLGLSGLKMFFSAAKAAGIKVISEVTAASQIADMYDYVDIFQVGTRNTQNFNLLHELGRVDKPVLIKRGMSGTLDELLQSAEYVFSSGNEKIILCERGIRTFEKAYRNTLDLNAVPVLKVKTHLPVVVDPSHGIGLRRFVEPMALAAVMAGADGILIEIHHAPEEALSDGDQTLNFSESARLFRRVNMAVALRGDFANVQ